MLLTFETSEDTWHIKFYFVVSTAPPDGLALLKASTSEVTVVITGENITEIII